MKNILTALSLIFTLVVVISCGSPNENKKKSGFGQINEIKKENTAGKSKASSNASKSDEKVEVTVDLTKEQLSTASKLISTVDENLVEAVNAKKVFKNYCAICHGIKGNMEINGSKDLSKTKTNLTQRVAQVYYGKGLMTPFKGVIKDEEIIAVSKFLDTLRK